MRYFVCSLMLLLSGCGVYLNSSPGIEEALPASPNDVVPTPAAKVPAPITKPTPAADANRPASGPTVRFIGRFDTTDANAVKFSWSGSTIVTRFSGTSLDIQLAEDDNATYGGVAVDNFYDVFIDGALSGAFGAQHGVTTYRITPADLVAGDHYVRVVKRTEAQIGEASFMGFVPNAGGTLLPAPLPRSRRIQFIGDSITAGYGDTAESNYPTMCGFTPETENADLTYAWDTGEALSADVFDIAFSGKGIVQNIDPVGDPYFTMPLLYPNTNPANANVLWDASSWVPDVVVVNMGTNDYYGVNTSSGIAAPSDAAFIAGYESFIKQVRAGAPNAIIICALGPMLYNEALTQASTNVEQAVATLIAQGDKSLSYLAFAPDQAPLPAGYGSSFGCSYHPDITTHQAMSQALVAAIKAKTGW